MCATADNVRSIVSSYVSVPDLGGISCRRQPFSAAVSLRKKIRGCVDIAGASTRTSASIR